MGHMGWWRPFGLEAELEMADDPVDGLSFFDKRDDSHLTATCGAGLQYAHQGSDG